MQLEKLGLSKADITKLNKHNMFSVEDVQMFLPRLYRDFSCVTPLSPEQNGNFIAVIGQFTEMRTDKTNNVLMLKAKVYEKDTNKKLNIMWIGSYYLKKIICHWLNTNVIVCGKMTYSEDYHSYHMNNPLIFTNKISDGLRILPIYTKMTGISNEWMQNMIHKSLQINIPDATPVQFIRKHGLMSRTDAVTALHLPNNMEQVQKAQQRLVYDKMFGFARDVLIQDKNSSKKTDYPIVDLDVVNNFVRSLPFKLTDSQMNIFNVMRQTVKDGNKINALVQGDVGSGKTMCAFLMMFAMAGSGFQSVLMAPTEILARQHYEELKGYAEPLGIKVVLLCSGLKAKERKSVLEDIRSGAAKMIVGTHSVSSESVEYDKLALAIVDEEHKFGVTQEEKLLAKSKNDIHFIAMSATPIPRTIASALYGESVQVYDLEKPTGRLKVQTAIYDRDRKIFEFAEQQIEEGRQVYVVCPLITTTEKSEKDSVLSIEQTETMYKNAFAKLDPNIRIASVSGKTDKDTAKQTLEEFSNGTVNILISTTVIEVGVNNPNASVIIINNAERFGAAQLHQLRGRVGRGKYQSYCILKSSDIGNERLNLICNTTDGYEIAQMDAEHRGPGDILGDKQSGKNEEISLLLKYPNMYEIVKKDAKEFLEVDNA